MPDGATIGSGLSRYHARMYQTSSHSGPLPAESGPAVWIIRELAAAGHMALLAGGCVRDLLLDRAPHDYDVATDATPERVCEIFRSTRKVGAQFGVVLVRRKGRWVEVATFRTDGEYRDGRRPESVTFGEAREDALRRDFTVNGMFLDPIAATILDYVGGQADLRARVIRAIGEPAERFEEDHLRLLRAVRFAARLEFAIEPSTLAAIRGAAAKLARVAAERVRDELEKMLVHPNRRAAIELMVETGLPAYLWKGAAWEPRQLDAALELLGRLPAGATFELAFTALVFDRPLDEIGRICRVLTFSNEQRETTLWLARHQADLDDVRPETPSLASLKRLMAHDAFAALRDLATARLRALPDGEERLAALERRLATIAPETVRPAPLVNGDDLKARGVQPGPLYGRVLAALYTEQLDERIVTRAAALQWLDARLERESSSLQ